MNTSTLVTREHMHNNMTVIITRNGGVGFITDGKVNTGSALFLRRPSSGDPSKVMYPIDNCTYAVYGDEMTGEIFVEEEDGVDQNVIDSAISEMRARIDEASTKA